MRLAVVAGAAPFTMKAMAETTTSKAAIPKINNGLFLGILNSSLYLLQND